MVAKIEYLVGIGFWFELKIRIGLGLCVAVLELDSDLSSLRWLYIHSHIVFDRCAQDVDLGIARGRILG